MESPGLTMAPTDIFLYRQGGPGLCSRYLGCKALSDSMTPRRHERKGIEAHGNGGRIIH